MKIIVTILIFAIVVLIGWNIFPMVIGLIKVLLAVGFISIFVLGFIVGRWIYKNKK